jgi:hypothetical protein
MGLCLSSEPSKHAIERAEGMNSGLTETVLLDLKEDKETRECLYFLRENTHIVDIFNLRTRSGQSFVSTGHIFPSRFDFVLIKKMILLSGGILEDETKLKRTWKLSLKTQKICLKDDMNLCKSDHTLVKTSDLFTYCIGGYNFEEGGFLSYCEKYDLKENKWSSIPKLTHGRSLASACFVRGKEVEDVYGKENHCAGVVYVFAGSQGLSSLNSVEKINIQEEISGWCFCHCKNNDGELVSSYNMAALQIDNSHIFVFGGHKENLSKGYFYEFNQDELCKEELAGDVQNNANYLHTKPLIYEDHVAIFNDQKDIQIYSLAQKEWSVVKAQEWLQN